MIDKLLKGLFILVICFLIYFTGWCQGFNRGYDVGEQITKQTYRIQ